MTSYQNKLSGLNGHIKQTKILMDTIIESETDEQLLQLYDNS